MIALLAVAAVCLPVQSERITAGDLAAVVPAFHAMPASKVLSYAPLPGYSRVFPEAELRQRVPDARELPASVCFEWRMRLLSQEEIVAAMLASLPSGSHVSIVETSHEAVPPGNLSFPLACLRNGNWKGYVEWAPGRKYSIWGKVRVQAPFSRVIATEAIRSGQRIEESNVRLETGVGEPATPGMATSLGQVIGRVARRLIPADSPVPTASVDVELTVARGDPVHVRVVAGNAALAFDGVSEGRGAVGDIVPVRNPFTKRLVHARVESRGSAIAELTPSGRKASQ